MTIIHVFTVNHTKDHTHDICCFCEPAVVVHKDVMQVIHLNREPVVFPEWEKTILGSGNKNTMQ